MSSLKYWVWLSLLEGVGSVATGALLRHFGTPEAIYAAGPAEYREIDGVKHVEISLLKDKNLAAADKALAACQKIGCRIITMQDADYPERLRNIFDPPILLYVRGNLPFIDDEPVVAIVGTRSCTPYGVRAAENIGRQLASRGLIVVTGLARGIDAAAARGALRGGGCVVGVIGSGLDIVYPKENASLYNEVARSGAVISEYAPGTPATAWHFPARNRILSGLSLGVTVVEAPKKSGALITAARALEQGRDVFVVPGNIDAKSFEGSNSLLREGAIPALSGEDIVSEYAELFPDKITIDGQPMSAPRDRENAVRPVSPKTDAAFGFRDAEKKEIDNNHAVDYIDIDELLSALDGEEKTVAETIGTAAMSVDEIITGSGLTAPQVLTALTMLEIKGCAARDGSKWSLGNRA